MTMDNWPLKEILGDRKFAQKASLENKRWEISKRNWEKGKMAET
jgi:hypothetical protein